MKDKMPKRFTDTDKWKDSWYLDLSLESKLLFSFLCDKCDQAGFIERHDRTMAAIIGIDASKFDSLFTELSKSVVVLDKMIWVKNFLRHQKNLPLNPENNAHKGAIESLIFNGFNFSVYYPEFIGFTFEELKSLLGASEGLTSPIGKGKGNSNGKDLPTLAQVIEFFKDEIEANKFYDYFESNGWKVGGKATMKNWQAAARNWKRRTEAPKENKKQIRREECWMCKKIMDVETLQKHKIECRKVYESGRFTGTAA